jgi:hypothetical protein
VKLIDNLLSILYTAGSIAGLHNPTPSCSYSQSILDESARRDPVRQPPTKIRCGDSVAEGELGGECAEVRHCSST